MKTFEIEIKRTDVIQLIVAAESEDEARVAIEEYGVQTFADEYNEEEGEWEIDSVSEGKEIPEDLDPDSFEDEGIEINCGVVDGEFYAHPDTFEEAYMAHWEDRQKNPPPPPPDPNQLSLLPEVPPDEEK